MSDGDWASDVPVSLPKPVALRLPGEVRIPMSGFVFTVDGLFHDIDPTTYDDMATPTYLPHDASAVIYGDDIVHPRYGPESDDFEIDV